MPFGFLQRGSLSAHARHVQLSSYEPTIHLDGLVRGVDNIRHDVALSSRFMETARQHIFRLIVKHGRIEALIEQAAVTPRPTSRIAGPGIGNSTTTPKVAEAGDFKRALLDLHVAALNRAKAENNVSVDFVARLAA